MWGIKCGYIFVLASPPKQCANAIQVNLRSELQNLYITTLHSWCKPGILQDY